MGFKEKDLKIDNLRKQCLLGAFIRLHRESENMSLSFMADTVKISKAYLSDLEHGKRIPQEYTLAQIIKVLDVPFNADTKIIDFLEEKLRILFKSYVDLDENREFEMYKEDFLFKEEYEYSLGFLQFYLLNFIKNIRLSTNKDEIEKYKSILNSNIDLISSNEKNIFYDVLALEAIKNNNYNEALNFLNKGLESSTNLTDPIIYYHLCVVYQKLNMPVLALSNCYKASKLFNKDASFFRVLYLMMYEGNCYSRLHSYDIAKKLYIKVLEKSNLDSSGSLKTSIYNNLSWNALKEKNYIDCINFTIKAQENDSDFSNIILYLPISYYYLKEFEKCKAEISNNYSKLDYTTYHKYILDAINLLIENRKADAINPLTICLSMDIEYEMRFLILQFMCDILKDLKNYELLSKYQEDLLNTLI